MARHFLDSPAAEIPGKLKQALAMLLEAVDYAADTDSDPWDFAVPIRSLQKSGLNFADLLWLVRKEFVKHAREVTAPGDDGREFRATGNLTFVRRTCFVLTETGVAQARSLGESQLIPRRPNESLHASGGNGQATPIPAPLVPVVQWDADMRKLQVNGKVVKRFKWPAINQETVLSAFHEEGWPERIDDPLPPLPEQDPHRRLSDTIKCLNRKQTNHLIHFRGDGTGEGVLWEYVEAGSKVNGSE